MTRAVSSLQRESQVERSGGEFTVPGPFQSWKRRHLVSHTGPPGEPEVLQMGAGSTNAIKMQFNRFLEGFCGKTAVILQRKLKLDLWRR